jgi:hypothetical protein
VAHCKFQSTSRREKKEEGMTWEGYPLRFGLFSHTVKILVGIVAGEVRVSLQNIALAGLVPDAGCIGVPSV